MKYTHYDPTMTEDARYGTHRAVLCPRNCTHFHQTRIPQVVGVNCRRCREECLRGNHGNTQRLGGKMCAHCQACLVCEARGVRVQIQAGVGEEFLFCGRCNTWEEEIVAVRFGYHSMQPGHPQIMPATPRSGSIILDRHRRSMR